MVHCFPLLCLWAEEGCFVPSQWFFPILLCKYLGLDGILGFCLKFFLGGRMSSSQIFHIGALVTDASCLRVILFFFFLTL